MDGLPTLKVQTLLHDGICEHKRCSTHPIPTKFCRTSSRHIRESRKRGLSKVNYAQMLLEEAADEHYESQNDVTFKPVLVWKPHQKSSPPRGDVCRQHVQPSDTFSGQSTVGVNADASKYNNDVYEEAKQSLTVFKTDLTDMLPPRRKGQKNKVNTYTYMHTYIHTYIAVTGRKRTATISGLIRLVISLECFIEITPDFKFQSHSYWQSLFESL